MHACMCISTVQLFLNICTFVNRNDDASTYSGVLGIPYSKYTIRIFDSLSLSLSLHIILLNPRLASQSSLRIGAGTHYSSNLNNHKMTNNPFFFFFFSFFFCSFLRKWIKCCLWLKDGKSVLSVRLSARY